MKRLLTLVISLVLLAGCGSIAEAPEEPTTDMTTEAITTESQTTTTAPEKPVAKPFTKDDITAIEEQFKTVGDYVKAVPAAWYKVVHYDAYGCEIFVELYSHKPNEDSEYFLRLQTLDESLCEMVEYKFAEPMQELPKILLDAQDVKICSISFFEAGDGITPPRGIKIGDNAQKLFEAYPDYRTGNSDVLYDITTLYPEAKPAWGKWDGEGWSNIDFLGGGIMEDGVGFTYVEPPWGWDDREHVPGDTWLNMYNPRYLLTYQVGENIIQDVKFMLLFHPG